MYISKEHGHLVVDDGVSVLLGQVADLLPHTMVTIEAGAGTGKTTFTEGLQKNPELGIDETIIFRMQGITSEDFRLPYMDTIEIERVVDGKKTVEKSKTVEFAQMGFFKEIDANPDKTYLLLLDEVNRASRDVLPVLFSLFERKFLDGKMRKNLRIMACINDGDEYSTTLDFTDPALRRRTVIMRYEPAISDFRNFIKDHNYHSVICELSEFLNIGEVINYDTEGKFEQSTNFGSYNLFNEKLKAVEKRQGKPLSYKDIEEELVRTGALFFSANVRKVLVEKMILLDSLNSVDIQKEIISKGGIKDGIKDKQGNRFDIEKRGRELMTKTSLYIKNEVIKGLQPCIVRVENEPTKVDVANIERTNYMKKNANNIIKTFESEKTLLISTVLGLEQEIKRELGNSIDPKVAKTTFQQVIAGFANTFIKSANDPTHPEHKVCKDLYSELSEAVNITQLGASA